MTVEASRARERRITREISAYYVENARQLPWRARPGAPAPDPYHVWLSEVMLQQTTVAAVKEYFAKFVSRWPTVTDLAAADEADILAAWAGLGYYARARNLHKCAREVVDSHGGQFPSTENQLRALPGIGDYTAAAIAAIAYRERTVVVDANIERLVARLFAIDTPLPKGKAAICAAMDAITPPQGVGDFAQACMDMGATICTARDPKCLLCPVQGDCLALVQGRPEEFPVKPPKKSKSVRRGRFFWIEYNGDILLVQRPGKGMLAGMRALPDDGWRAGADGDAVPPFPGEWQLHEAVVQHGFTHFALSADLAVWRGARRPPDLPGATWWPLDRIDEAGLPTLFGKAVRWKLAQEEMA